MTAVNWMIDELIKKHVGKVGNEYVEIFEQAKQMEKEQIKYAYDEGDIQLVNAEQYYNETFKSQNITLQNESESKVITELSDDEIKPKHKVGKFIVEAIKEKIARTSQTEISDEEIEEMLFHHSNEYAYGFKDAIKWYREQLKNTK